MKKVIAFLNTIFPLGNPASAFLYDHTERIECKKGEKLLQQGDICRYVWFIEKGVLRSYESTPLKEHNSWLMKENDIITSVVSFFKEKESAETIEALEHCVLHAISKKDLFEGLEQHKDLLMLTFMRVVYYYCQTRETESVLRKKSSEAFFIYLLTEHPGLVSRVPVKMLASFMGISKSTLTRIKKRLQKPKANL